MNKEDAIRKFVLDNAIKHAGKAMPGNIVGKLLGNYPDWKSEMKEIMPLIQKIVNEINKLTVFEQTDMLKDLAPELLEKKPKIQGDDLKPLPNVKMGNVVMRFEPSPSGSLHIGHSIGLLLNSEYCKKYDGKLILRIADTNPDNICKDAYNLIPEAAKWVTEDNISQIIIQSERMEIYYQHALELVQKGHLYICECDPEDFRSLITKQMPCPCREKSDQQHVERWHKLFDGYNEGDAVARMKTNIQHKNPALRDFAVFRINENEHPKQGKKYRVWPLMNFAVAIDDHELALTHVLRGKDHLDNTRRQMYIYEFFNWTPPEFIHYGLVNFEGINLSASQTANEIKQGLHEGWDSIELPFLQAMKKRGYQPKAFQKWVRSQGLTMVDKKVAASEFFKALNFYNKEIIDPIADRFFFLPNPKELLIDGTNPKQLELDLHPENKEGGRKFSITEMFYIAESDFNRLESGTLYRLMDCLNFSKQNTSFHFDSDEYEKWGRQKGAIMHWLPGDNNNINVKLIKQDGTSIIGLGEPALANVKQGQIVQFERITFASYIGREDDYYIFWELHR